MPLQFLFIFTIVCVYNILYQLLFITFSASFSNACPSAFFMTDRIVTISSQIVIFFIFSRYDFISLPDTGPHEPFSITAA